MLSFWISILSFARVGFSYVFVERFCLCLVAVSDRCTEWVYKRLWIRVRCRMLVVYERVIGTRV